MLAGKFWYVFSKLTKQLLKRFLINHNSKFALNAKMYFMGLRPTKLKD